MPLGHAGSRYIVRLVDDDDIPAGLLQKVLIAADILQRVDADDDAMVDLERILVGRNAQSQFGDAGRIKSHQWQGESVPEF